MKMTHILDWRLTINIKYFQDYLRAYFIHSTLTDEDALRVTSILPYVSQLERKSQGTQKSILLTLERP